MPEDLEERRQEPFDLSQYLELIRRRHMHFFIAMLLGWLLVVGASWIVPPRYKSSTLILVEQPKVPKDYVVSNISDDIEERLQSIREQIESRTRLLLIIDNFRLYAIRHHPLTPDEKVARMIRDIDIELVRDPGSNTINSFRVSYSAPTPQLAREVTSQLTTMFINDNQQKLEQESKSTTNFIERQLEDARASLAEQEARVRQFQSAHEGELPNQQASNLQILSGLQSQLQNEQDALNTAVQQRIYFQSLFEQYRALRATPKNADGSPVGIAAVNQQLQQMKMQLADLSTRYTDRYPAVENLKSEIAKTEKLRDQMAAEAAALPVGTPPVNGNRISSNHEVDEPNAPLLQLESQLQANQIEIANRQSAVGDLKARIDSYQRRLNAEPASEQELADLTRGYEQSQANYNELLKKKNDSAMATSMEQMQEGERFSVLDPPSLPLKPDFPNRLKFCALGLGVGLALGLFVVGGLELLDDRLHSDGDIEKLLPVEIISEIPIIVFPADTRRTRWRVALGWTVAIVAVIIIVGGSVLTYLHA